MSVIEKEIRCVLIPQSESWTLLPNAAVAEVISVIPYKKKEEGPPWLLGTIEWREQTVPLILFEGLLEIPLNRIPERAKIVVLNTVNGNTNLPYIAIVSQAIPRLAKISVGNLKKVPAAPKRVAILDWVQVNNYITFIPDLDYLERSVYKVCFRNKS